MRVLILNGSFDIPEAFPQGVISPFMAWVFMAPGAAAFFYILFFTDWLPKPDMSNPRERAFMVLLLTFALVVLAWLLYLQLFQGGVAGRWFPW